MHLSSYKKTLQGLSGEFLVVNCALKIVGLHRLHLEYKSCGWNVCRAGGDLAGALERALLPVNLHSPRVSVPFAFAVLPFRQGLGRGWHLVLYSVCCKSDPWGAGGGTVIDPQKVSLSFVIFQLKGNSEGGIFCHLCATGDSTSTCSTLLPVAHVKLEYGFQRDRTKCWLWGHKS